MCTDVERSPVPLFIYLGPDTEFYIQPDVRNKKVWYPLHPYTIQLNSRVRKKKKTEQKFFSIPTRGIVSDRLTADSKRFIRFKWKSFRSQNLQRRQRYSINILYFINPERRHKGIHIHLYLFIISLHTHKKIGRDCTLKPKSRS